MSELRKKIENKENLNGTYININDPCISKIVSRIGFDYIWIDMEHSYLSYENLLCHIQTIQACGIPVIVRAPQNDLTATKKILDMGVDGIIFPMVRNKKEADELISSTLYPPEGCRGFGPLNAVSYGIEDAYEYVCDNKRICRFIQIEHKELVDELEEVIQNPYIDGYIFGANDLSGSVGELLNIFGEKTTELIKKSLDVLQKNYKYTGVLMGSSCPEDIKKWSDMGIHMISTGSDFLVLAEGMQHILKNMKKVH
ncbi:MAG: aldolase [Clostridia bacterium]|nr:aldolase [Clostridia bacterium]